MTITKELVEQWANDCNVTASNAFRASTHDLDCIFKAWPEELLAFAQRAAAYGAEQREAKLMAVGIAPKLRIPVDPNAYGPLARYEYGYTAEQLAAARLQGAALSAGWEQERNVADAQALRITDLERVNQGLLEALKELVEANSYYFPVGNPWGDKARAAVAAAEAHTGKKK